MRVNIGRHCLECHGNHWKQVGIGIAHRRSLTVRIGYDNIHLSCGMRWSGNPDLACAYKRNIRCGHIPEFYTAAVNKVGTVERNYGASGYKALGWT
jgi:hypothetical protein